MADSKRLVRFNYKAYFADAEERLYDTTDMEAAKEAGIYNEKYRYEPMAYVIGSKNIFPALDEAIAAAEVGKEVEITIPCENAAGPKNPKLIETYPLKDFTKQEINPYPGLPVNLGNRTGIVLSVGAGRVKVDFNNQFAGHDLMYRFTVIEEVTDAVAKAKAVLEMNVGNADGFEFDIQDDKVVVTESEMCKFNQNWMIAKYKIVTELRDIFGVGRIDFVQVWDANQKI